MDTSSASIISSGDGSTAWLDIEYLDSPNDLPSVYEDWDQNKLPHITGGMRIIANNVVNSRFYLVCSANGKNWILWPFNPANNWSLLDKLFEISIVEPPIPDNAAIEAQQDEMIDEIDQTIEDDFGDDLG